MILTAHQSSYFPWLGLFHKIAASDLYCILDNVQYQTGEFINRNQIKTQSGPVWITVPVQKKSYLEKKISEIKIIKDSWPKKQFRTIEQSYVKAPFFNDYIYKIEDILLGRDHIYLADLAHDTLQFGLDALEIKTPVVKASDYDFSGHKSDLIIDICRTLKADHFLFGAHGRDYAEAEKFSASGIQIHFQEYIHPEYNQCHGAFTPFMSVIDILFNMGPDSFEILMKDNIRSYISS